MNWADLLGIASGGGIFGLIGALGKGWLEIKQARVRIEERKVEGEIQRDLLKLKADTATIEGEARSFTASQESAKGDGEAVVAVAPLAQTPAQRWILLLAEVLRTTTRPLLTWGAHVMAFVIFFYLTDDMQRAVLLQVFGMASTYGGWWFGSRQVFRFNK